jgi:hypothetical protein
VDEPVTLHVGDCLTMLADMEPASVDAIVTDPPYELGFMGRAWDASGIAYNVEVWRQCLRVLKPGGHLLAFGGTRTYHRLTVAIEDAGFEIRDSLHWIYGSGFPKSLDVGKAIDKAAGATRTEVGERIYAGGHVQRSNGTDLGALNDDGWKPTDGRTVTAPATDDARRWQGWGTALKPAHEPIVLARKPLAGTVAASVLAHGTGALNVDGCRVATTDNLNGGTYYGRPGGETSPGWRMRNGAGEFHQPPGRWPANVVLTHPPALDAAGDVVGDACEGECVDGCPVAAMDAQSGTRTSGTGAVIRASAKGGARSASIGAESRPAGTPMVCYGDTGGASRYFPIFRYQAKAPKAERPRLADGTTHPTVKPLALMRWLVTLVTPPGGVVLDPFAGSGTTGEAASLEGARCVLVERDETHAELIRVRLDKDTAA